MSRSSLHAVILPALLLIVWETASHSGCVDPRFLPPLEQVWVAGRADWLSGDLAQALRASLVRDVLGFVIGSTAGTALGIIIGLSGTAQRLLGPMLVVHRQIALFAWIPLLSAWFGGGEVGKIAFIAMAAFQPTIVNSWRGVANIPGQYRELSSALAFGRLEFLTVVALPGSLAEIFAGLRAALIYAWMATIGAELLLDVAPGLGGRMDEGQHLFEMNLLVFYLIVLAVVGGIFTFGTGWLEMRLARWRTV